MLVKSLIFPWCTLSLTGVGAMSGRSVISATRKKFLKRVAQYNQQIDSGTLTKRRKRYRHLTTANRQQGEVWILLFYRDIP